MASLREVQSPTYARLNMHSKLVRQRSLQRFFAHEDGSQKVEWFQ